MRILMYNPNLKTRGGGEKVYLALASLLSMNNEVTLFDRSNASLDELGEYFNTDLSRVKVHRPKKRLISYVIERIPVARLRIMIDILINTKDIKKFSPQLFINNEHYSRLPPPIKNSVYICMFPHDIKKHDSNRDSLVKKIYHFIFDAITRIVIGRSGPHNYRKIIANSVYTQKWIKKRWNKDSDVLYPICEDMGPSGLKEKIILNVGRFSATTKIAHDKKQDALIEAFKLLHQRDPNYRMILVGGIAQDDRSREHVEHLHKISKGYPIEFHHNASFFSLKKYYQESEIYWHAAGYGVDAENSPEKMEHFGIVTTEAMSAGCIPIVFNGGGQSEIIKPGVNGYLFNDIQDLVTTTHTVVHKKHSQKKILSQNAVKDSEKYGIQKFKSSALRLFSELI